MKNGLSYFDNGGEVKVTTAKPRTGVSPAGTTSLGPEQTESILANMQALIDKRTGPMNTFLSGLQEASAWGAGGEQGPSAALTAVRRQRQLEEADTMGMQEKMAAFRAAQAKAERDAKLYASVSPGAAGAGGAGGTGGTAQGFTDPSTGVYIPPEQLQREKLAGPDALAARQEYLKTAATERAKRESSVELDKLVPYAIGGREEMITLRDAVELAKKNPSLPRNQKILAQAENLAPGVTSAPAANVPLSVRNNNPGNIVDTATGKIKVFATPEEGDRALQKDLELKISGQSPIVKERFGSQVGDFMSPALLAETWAPSTATGNTPESTQNYAKAVANAIGIGVTDKIPNTPEAIGKAKAAITKFESGNYPAPTTTAAATANVAPRREPTLPEIKAAEEIAKEEGITSARKRAESSEAKRVEFEADTDATTVTDGLVTAKRVQDMVKNNPTIAGVLQSPDLPSALATVLRRGVGNFGIQDIEDAIYQTMPTTTRESLGERNELITYLARIELQAAKMIKGQGQITEGEREILARASSSIKDPAESIYKKARMLEAIARKNDALGKVYKESSDEQTKNFRKFIKEDPRVAALNKQYRAELTEILNEKVDFTKLRAAAGAKKPVYPKEVQDAINRNKPGAKQ
jgi:hypothetical protein